MWNNTKMFSVMSNLQTYHFKLDFQNVDQHTRGKWLIHGTIRRKDNQLQSLEAVEYPSRECKPDIKESKGNMFNPIFNENVHMKMIYGLPCNAICWPLMGWLVNEFHLWLRQSRIILANHPTRDQKLRYSGLAIYYFVSL